MLDLILAVASSALVSITMRVSERKVPGSTAMLSVNYLMCLMLAWADSGFLAPFPRMPGLGLTLALGLLNGVLYLAGFVLLQINIPRNGVVLSATFMRLGLLVSMLVSVVFFREAPSGSQWLGFALAVAAIVGMYYRGGSQRAGSPALLLGMLVIVGVTDAMSKVYTQVGNPALLEHFLLYTFGAALVCCTGLAFRQGSGIPGKWDILFGLLIGIPNFFSARFLLGALESLRAVLVYPVHSVATILVITLTGVLAFHERLERRQWIALTMILSALVLLNV